MVEKRGTFVFSSEDSYNDAKEHVFRQMHNDYGFPKIEFTGKYRGEYRVDIWSGCSDVVKAADIIRKYGGKFLNPWEFW